MKKGITIIIVCLLVFMFFAVGCEDKKIASDQREGEIIVFLNREDWDGARAKVEELYEGDKRFKEMYDWVGEVEERRAETQRKIDELYPSRKLEVMSGYSHRVDGGYGYAEGNVKNISDVNIEYFEVRIDYCDDNGNVLDSNYTNDSLTLKPGEVRSFKIMSRWNEKYRKYKLSIGKVK